MNLFTNETRSMNLLIFIGFFLLVSGASTSPSTRRLYVESQLPTPILNIDKLECPTEAGTMKIGQNKYVEDCGQIKCIEIKGQAVLAEIRCPKSTKVIPEGCQYRINASENFPDCCLSIVECDANSNLRQLTRKPNFASGKSYNPFIAAEINAFTWSPSKKIDVVTSPKSVSVTKGPRRNVTFDNHSRYGDTLMQSLLSSHSKASNNRGNIDYKMSKDKNFKNSNKIEDKDKIHKNIKPSFFLPLKRPNQVITRSYSISTTSESRQPTMNEKMFKKLFNDTLKMTKTSPIKKNTHNAREVMPIDAKVNLNIPVNKEMNKILYKRRLSTINSHMNLRVNDDEIISQSPDIMKDEKAIKSPRIQSPKLATKAVQSIKQTIISNNGNRSDKILTKRTDTNQYDYITPQSTMLSKIKNMRLKVGNALKGQNSALEQSRINKSADMQNNNSSKRFGDINVIKDFLNKRPNRQQRYSKRLHIFRKTQPPMVEKKEILPTPEKLTTNPSINDFETITLFAASTSTGKAKPKFVISKEPPTIGKLNENSETVTAKPITRRELLKRRRAQYNKRRNNIENLKTDRLFTIESTSDGIRLESVNMTTATKTPFSHIRKIKSRNSAFKLKSSATKRPKDVEKNQMRPKRGRNTFFLQNNKRSKVVKHKNNDSRITNTKVPVRKSRRRGSGPVFNLNSKNKKKASPSSRIRGRMVFDFSKSNARNKLKQTSRDNKRRRKNYKKARKTSLLDTSGVIRKPLLESNIIYDDDYVAMTEDDIDLPPPNYNPENDPDYPKIDPVDPDFLNFYEHFPEDSEHKDFYNTDFNKEDLNQMYGHEENEIVDDISPVNISTIIISSTKNSFKSSVDRSTSKNFKQVPIYKTQSFHKILKNPPHNLINEASNQENTSYQLRNSSYDHNNPSYEPKHHTHDLKNPSYKSTNPLYNQKGPSYELKNISYELKDPLYNQKDLAYHLKNPSPESNNNSSYGSKNPSYQWKNPVHDQKDYAYNLKNPPYELKNPLDNQKDPSYESSNPSYGSKNPDVSKKPLYNELNNHSYSQKNLSYEIKNPIVPEFALKLN